MTEEKGNFQDTMQFLMYSYFGDWEDDPLYAAISRAYRDATMRAAFSFPDSELKEVLELCGSKIICQEIVSYIGGGLKQRPYTEGNTEAKSILKNSDLCKKINEEIQKINKDDSKDEYTIWHEKLCTELVTLYSFKVRELDGKDTEQESFPFSYGNAQKWVNMTMKYLYLMSPLFEGNDSVTWPEKIKDKSGLFHVPLDSYILRALFFKPGATSKKYKNSSIRKQINDNYNGELIKYCLENDEVNSVNSDGSLKKKNWGIKGEKDSVAWSNIASYEDYENIQKAVKEKIPKEYESDPLAWENKVWIYASQILNV